MRSWHFFKNYLIIAALFYIVYKLFVITSIPIYEEEYERKTQASLQDDLKFENNTIWQSLFTAMPHLAYVNPSMLEPIYILGRKPSRRRLVISIPAIERSKEDYLLETLKSLFSFLTPEDRTNVTLIVFLSNEKGENSIFVKTTRSLIKEHFNEEINSDLLQVVLIPTLFYPPNLDKMHTTFNDSNRRMYWRTRQNIDYLYSMLFSVSLGDYYLQLEDDIQAAKGYLKNIYYFIEINQDKPWIMLEFSSLGCIGKLYSPSNFHRYVNAIAMFFGIKPVDWILDDLHRSMFCSPEWQAKRCRLEISKYLLSYEPAQFQHIGKYSSLQGKIQRLKEKKFGMVNIKKLRHNPTALLKTSMVALDSLQTLWNAYFTSSFFHTNEAPKAGDYIEFAFKQPVKLKGVLLTTGNTANPELIITEEAALIAFDDKRQRKEIGYFDNDGRLFARNFEEPVEELRVEIQKNLNHSVIFDQIAFTVI